MSIELSAAIATICRRLGVAELYVFGSRGPEIAARVRGQPFDSDAGSASDVDVAVRPSEGARLDIDTLVALANELERVLAVGRVDVVALPVADPFLALDAIRGELIYCQDPHAQAEYELYVLARAGDLAPYQRRRLDWALSRYADR